MSEEVSLLTIDQAAIQAGVTKDTIERYRDLGLLKIHANEGKEMFSDEDIRLLFNSKRTNSTTSNTPSRNENTTSPSRDEDEKTTITTKEDDTSEDLPRLKNIIKEVENASKDTSSGRMEDEKTTEFAQSNNSQQYSDSNHSIDISSIELLELTRSLKDQLEIVKEERNWLRKRIEKLESHSEREQMLRMSESDTIRTLIAQSEKKRKNPLSFLLSWTQTGKEKSTH